MVVATIEVAIGNPFSDPILILYHRIFDLSRQKC